MQVSIHLFFEISKSYPGDPASISAHHQLFCLTVHQTSNIAQAEGPLPNVPFEVWSRLEKTDQTALKRDFVRAELVPPDVPAQIDRDRTTLPKR